MNIQSNDPSGSSASLAAWYDRVYGKFDSVRNRYSLELGIIHKRVYELCSQSPELATKWGPLKTRIEILSKLLEVSRNQFYGWSREKICIFFRRLEEIRRLIIYCKAPASRQHMLQRQSPGSQPQIPAQHFMPSSQANKTKAGTRFQTSLQSTSQLHPGNLIPPLSKAGTRLQNIALDPKVSSISSPLSTSSSSLTSLKNSFIISPISAAGSANRPQGLVKDDQILSQTTNKDQASSTGSPKILTSPLMAEVTLPEENRTGDSDESSLQQLLDMVKSVSDEALCAVLHNIGSILDTMDIIGGTTVNCGSQAFVYYPKDLSQGGNFNSLYGIASARRVRCHPGGFSAAEEATANDGLQGLSSETNFLESNAECRKVIPEFQ